MNLNYQVSNLEKERLPAHTPTSRVTSKLNITCSNQEIEQDIPQMSKLFCSTKNSCSISSNVRKCKVDLISVNLLSNHPKTFDLRSDAFNPY